MQSYSRSSRRTRVGVATAGAPIREPPLTRAARCGRLSCDRFLHSPQCAARAARLWHCTGAHTGAIRANDELFEDLLTITGYCLLWRTSTFLISQDWFASARKLGIQFPASIYPIITSSASAIGLTFATMIRNKIFLLTLTRSCYYLKFMINLILTLYTQ